MTTTEDTMDLSTELFHEIIYATKSPCPQREFEFIRDKLISKHTSYSGIMMIFRFELENRGYNVKKLKGEAWKNFELTTRNLPCSTTTRAAQDAAARLRDIRFIVDRWPRDVLHYYGFDRTNGQTVSKLLRVCAQDFPDFCQDFVPVANYVLLHKHRSAFYYKNYNDKIGFHRGHKRKGVKQEVLKILVKLKSQDIVIWKGIEFSLPAALTSGDAVETWTTPNQKYRRIVEGWMGENCLDISSYLLKKDRYGMLYYLKPTAAEGIQLRKQLKMS